MPWDNKSFSLLKKCPNCAKGIDQDARGCKYCGEYFDKSTKNNFNHKQRSEHSERPKFKKARPVRSNQSKARSSASNNNIIISLVILVPILIGGLYIYNDYQDEQERLRKIEQNRIIQQQLLERQLQKNLLANEKRRLEILEYQNQLIRQQQRQNAINQINKSINQLGCYYGNTWQC